MDSPVEFIGHLHPVLLHFPIALLIAGAVVEATRLRRESPAKARAVVWLLGSGAALAIGATGSGWVLATYERVRSDERATLELHRWFGLATAALACIAWITAHVWREAASAVQIWLRRLSVLAAVVLVTVASHLGAVIVWGKDWFSFGSP